MALRGNLKDFSLPDVFQLVTFSRKTGVLRIRRTDSAEGSVWFRDGDVFFASSNWHSEFLGERLVRAQRITPQALSRALDVRSAEPPEGRRLGQILVDEGYIADKVIESFVQEQIQDTIFDLMRWDEGEFDFEAMPEIADEDIGLTVSIENIVMEGSRRLEEWSRIKKKIPSTDVVFKMATAPGEGTFEISLKPIEWQLLLLIDGTRSVADLATETSRTDFEVARIIYGLFSAGLLEFATDSEIEHNRVERSRREAKMAEMDAERQRAEEASKKAALEREATLAAQAQARQRAEAERTSEAVDSASAPAPIGETAAGEPVEEPEFLGGGAMTPTADDQAALDAFMGAVLEAPAAEPSAAAQRDTQSAAPYVPGEEPAFITTEYDEIADSSVVMVSSAEELLGIAPLAPLPEAAPAPVVDEAYLVGSGALTAAETEVLSESDLLPVIEAQELSGADLFVTADAETPVASGFEHDLLALGLGELPADLLEPMGSEATAEAQPFVEVVGPNGLAELLPVIEQSEAAVLEIAYEPDVTEPMSETATWPEAGSSALSADTMDFSALIQSLDVDADEPVMVAAEDSGFDVDLLVEEAPTAPGGVISTDAFLEDIGIEELGMSGGMTDELSALTGAERRQSVRPQASVNALPVEGANVLKRDARVDRETLLKIIDGIEKL